jgi:hypothetical protein
MKIDLKKLRTDVEGKKRTRTASPIGKVKTGATKVIRENMVELRQMHAEGATWPELAAGLALQGVTQGDGDPISGRRLTALMHNISVGDAKLEANNNGTRRGAASTRVPLLRQQSTPGPKSVTLAAEMRNVPPPKESSAPVLDEQELRLAELTKHAHLLKRR